MASNSRSRWIPKEVAQQVISEMRQRCCLCRTLINPHRYESHMLAEVLEKHHIIHFSEGGGNIYENLILLCSACHTRVHKNPDDYSPDNLKEQKIHWVNFHDVIPNTLRLSESERGVVQVKFLVESINLSYSIWLSPDTSISELSEFVRTNIIKPLGEYDNNVDWINASELRLTILSKPYPFLNHELQIKDIHELPNDYLVAVTFQPIMHQLIPISQDESKKDAWVHFVSRELSEIVFHLQQRIDKISSLIKHHFPESKLGDSNAAIERLFFLAFMDVIKNIKTDTSNYFVEREFARAIEARLMRHGKTNRL
jgi:hypothetical protein